MGRIPVLTTFRTGDEVQDRNFDHIKQTLNPVLRNPLFASQDFRWIEVAPTTASSLPTFALQYRTPATANAVATWTTIASFTSAGQIVQPAWIAPTLTNSWVNFGSGNQPAGYMKDSQGVVHLRGLIRNGTVTASAFNLPTGYRPANDINFGTASNSAFGYGFIRGTANGGSVGDVVPAAGSNTWFSLDGITFDTR